MADIQPTETSVAVQNDVPENDVIGSLIEQNRRLDAQLDLALAEVDRLRQCHGDEIARRWKTQDLLFAAQKRIRQMTAFEVGFIIMVLCLGIATIVEAVTR